MRKFLPLFIVFVLSACSTATPTVPTSVSAGTAVFSVGADQSLNVPANLAVLPDEHTTFLPPTTAGGPYLVFAAGQVTGGQGGTVVLSTSDLQTFTLAPGYPAPAMFAPLAFTRCKAAYDPEFDLNYASAGSVVQDPTLPPGNLIMLYEAENHCPGAAWQQPFYATVGLARSSDHGKTWPAPIDSLRGGRDRYVVLKNPTPEPSSPEQPPQAIGNAIPSAFVDGNSLYVVYVFVGQGANGMNLRVARASLGGNKQLIFEKWYQGSFSQPGVGGQDSPMLPSRVCNGNEHAGQISYNDALGKYLLTLVCVNYARNASGTSEPVNAAWYYATATSLALEDWSAPQMIANSEYPIGQPCGQGGSGIDFDGWYPSFMTPGALAGHTGATGRVFFMNGCDTGTKHIFLTRTFTIAGITH